MATTSPDNIWTPDAADDYSLTTDLAAMADTVQDAITALRTQMGTDSGWINVTVFLNGFSSSPSSPVRYRKIGNQVFLDGHLYRSSAPGTTATLDAFTLPVGYRPTSVFWISTIPFWSSSVSVSTTGVVGYAANQLRTSSPGFPLNGISFLAS